MALAIAFLIFLTAPVDDTGNESAMPDFFGNNKELMFGKTPPWAIVTWFKRRLSSSSLRTANWRWRGIIRVFLLSRAAFPANSRISALKYYNEKEK